MRTLGVLVLVLLLSLLSTAQAACPILTENETDRDCPWAAIARDLDSVAKSETNPEDATLKVRKRLGVIAPNYLKHLEREAKVAGPMKLLWGRSINFDEGAKAIIVPDAILDTILSVAKVPARGVGTDSEHPERIAHAGFEHTYGYLLSNLKTPYGYKRLRWVRPDIEVGFGLPTGTIAPLPENGGLFLNLTYFAGRIVFRDVNPEEDAARKILFNAEGVAPGIRKVNYKSIHGRRLLEVLHLDGGRRVEIRTDFVPFTLTSGDATGGNSELLIYSFRDSALKLPYLITAFPVAKGFSDAALNPKNLGDDKPIITRYNAWVPGVTESKKPLTGTRSATTF